MNFTEKLNYLFKITGASNNEFTSETGIKQSMVSLYRTGKRTMPRKDETIEAICSFFATRINEEYQKQGIANFTSNQVLLDGQSFKYNLNILYSWLKDTLPDPDKSTKDMMNSFSHSINFNSSNIGIEAKRQTTNSFFGDAGKREALLSFISHALTVEEPKKIYLNVDESIEWFFKDINFVETVKKAISILISRGFKLYHILPPFSCRNYYEIIYNFIPFYQTEAVIPYYYPRFRDNVFRGFFLCMEDEISLLSFGIDSGHSSGFAALNTDKNLLECHKQMFLDFLDMTRPAMNVIHDSHAPETIFKNINNTEQSNISFYTSLPLNSIPIENVNLVIACIKDEAFKNRVKIKMKGVMPEIEKGKYVIDICNLYTVNDIKNKRIPILFPGISPDDLPTHTLTTYRLQLENIYNYMEKYDNYYVIFINNPKVPESSLMIRSGKNALFLRTSDNTTLFEITEPEIIRAGEEYLLRTAELYNYSGMGRIRAKEQLYQLINEFKAAEKLEEK